MLMGLAVAATCVAGLWQANWLAAETRVGRTLGPWTLRVSLVAGIVFGALLATGILNPVRW